MTNIYSGYCRSLNWHRNFFLSFLIINYCHLKRLLNLCVFGLLVYINKKKKKKLLSWSQNKLSKEWFIFQWHFRKALSSLWAYYHCILQPCRHIPSFLSFICYVFCFRKNAVLSICLRGYDFYGKLYLLLSPLLIVMLLAFVFFFFEYYYYCY